MTVKKKNAKGVIKEMGLTPEEWQVFAVGINLVATEAKAQTGLRAVFYHHCAGYVETPEKIDQLMTLTDPAEKCLLSQN